METGKVTESILKRSVLKQMKTKRNEVLIGAAVGKDCAVFALSEGENIASCIQSAAIDPAADDLACETNRTTVEKLLCRVTNNLAAAGANAFGVELSLLLPADTEESVLKELMQRAEAFCRKQNLQIAGGQTESSVFVSCPVMTVTGYGTIKKDVVQKLQGVKPGLDIVISKWIGLEATAILARKYKEDLLNRYPAYLVEEAAGFDRYLSVIPEAATAVKSGVCGMHDASKGGIFAALWEIAEGAGVGLKVDLKKLPLRQETVEVCELCGVNPYEMLSGGCLVMTAEDGEALAESLIAEGIPAVVVGRTTDENDRVLLNEEEVRYMDRPRNDALDRL